jgi:GNAT superfamily N-acetyltransferase
VTHAISPPVVVREILPDEHDAAASLLLTVYGAFAGELPPALLHRWLRDVVDPAGGTALGAHVGGRLVGTARLHLDGTYPVPLPPEAAGVRAVAVDPSVRRTGVANALMAECEARARTAGATALHLHTAPFMHAAVAFYERLGYRPDPARDLDVATHFAPDDPVHAGRGIVATAYRLDLGARLPPRGHSRPLRLHSGRRASPASNTGDEPIFAVIGRTDPNEQESVALMPELDDVHQARSAS